METERRCEQSISLPLLANIMLNELDKEMEKRGLKVNMTKSKVDSPQGLKYLGFGFYEKDAINAIDIKKTIGYN